VVIGVPGITGDDAAGELASGGRAVADRSAVGLRGIACGETEDRSRAGEDELGIPSFGRIPLEIVHLSVASAGQPCIELRVARRRRRGSESAEIESEPKRLFAESFLHPDELACGSFAAPRVVPPGSAPMHPGSPFNESPAVA
jgi:hypothetical protein